MVKVTATAGPGLTSSAEFVVTLVTVLPKPVISKTVKEKIRDSEQLPFFEYLERLPKNGGEPIIELEIPPGQRKIEYDLGGIQYLGDPADSIQVEIPNLSSKLAFAKIVKFGNTKDREKTYVLQVDLDYGQPS